MTNQILERWDDIPDILEAEVCREKRVEETKNTIHGGATILMTMMVVVLCLFSFPFLKERTCGACDCWKVGSVTDWIQILPSRVCRPKGKKKKKKLENLLRWFFFYFLLLLSFPSFHYSSRPPLYQQQQQQSRPPVVYILSVARANRQHAPFWKGKNVLRAITSLFSRRIIHSRLPLFHSLFSVKEIN